MAESKKKKENKVVTPKVVKTINVQPMVDIMNDNLAANNIELIGALASSLLDILACNDKIEEE